MAGIKDADGFAALRIDDIGGTAAGADPKWHPAILALQGVVEKQAEDNKSSVAVSVLFHVPGIYLQPDFAGVRLASRRVDDHIIRVEAALPKQAPDAPQLVLHECLIEAVWLAELDSQELPELRSLVTRLQGML